MKGKRKKSLENASNTAPFFHVGLVGHCFEGLGALVFNRDVGQ